MKVILFGATGMVGQGVLRECLLEPQVSNVLSIGRGTTGKNDPKLREIIHKDFTDFIPLKAELAGYDACFFCLGVTSVGKTEEAYRRVSYDFTMAAAGVLAELNPNMTFIYVSGAGTDSTEKGKLMWARVKGATENAVIHRFPKGFAFRPGLIQPLDGSLPRNKVPRIILTLMGPVIPLLMKLFPRHITTTRRVGRAMLRVAREGFPKRQLESWDINGLGGA